MSDCSYCACNPCQCGGSHDDLYATIAGLEEVLEDKLRLVRELDVAMHGEEGAAKQASLCDLIGPAKEMRGRIAELEAELSEALAYRKERERELGGVIADQDRKVAELEAEVAETDRMAVAMEERALYAEAEVARLVEEVETHMNGALRIASRAEKAEAQRDHLAEVLRKIAEFERQERNFRDDINGKPSGMSRAEQIARAALAQLEEK